MNDLLDFVLDAPGRLHRWLPAQRLLSGENVMSLSAGGQRALDSIEDGLGGSAPGLASLLATFARLASGEEMPVHEEIRVPGRRATRRPLRNRRPRRADVHRD